MIETTRKTRRRTNYVPVADQKMFDWCGANLPHIDYYITDIDHIFRSRKGCIMLVERKCRMSEIPNHQRGTLQVLHFALRLAHGKEAPLNLNGFKFKEKVIYKGSHLLQFEGTFFDEGKVYFDGEEVSEQELINILSFNNDECCF